jgi:hypothetical protein
LLTAFGPLVPVSAQTTTYKVCTSSLGAPVNLAMDVQQGLPLAYAGPNEAVFLRYAATIIIPICDNTGHQLTLGDFVARGGHVMASCSAPGPATCGFRNDAFNQTSSTVAPTDVNIPQLSLETFTPAAAKPYTLAFTLGIDKTTLVNWTFPVPSPGSTTLAVFRPPAQFPKYTAAANAANAAQGALVAPPTIIPPGAPIVVDDSSFSKTLTAYAVVADTHTHKLRIMYNGQPAIKVPVTLILDPDDPVGAKTVFVGHVTGPAMLVTDTDGYVTFPQITYSPVNALGNLVSVIPYRLVIFTTVINGKLTPAN